MKNLLIILLFAVATLSCTNSQDSKVRYSEKSATLQKSYDEVWNKALAYFSQKNIPITFTDKKAGLINVEFDISEELANKYADYNINGKNCELYGSKCKLFLILKPVIDKVDLAIDAQFEAKINNAKTVYKYFTSSSESVTCASTGLLEKEIFDYVIK